MTLRVLGLIPARAGSKGVPGKNERVLAGRPLLERARDAATASGAIDRLVLSTDSESVAELGRSLGIEVPFMRPADLATDAAAMLPVVQHALRALGKVGYRPDAVALLQPTSPLRTGTRIAQAIELLAADERATSVVSVAPIPPHLSPHYAMRIDDGRLVSFLSEGVLITRRQDVPAAYFRDGTIYLTRTDVVIASGDLYGDRCIPLVLPADEALSIDTEADWAEAERRLGSDT
jgi:CMP-N,N'-diacetyllegionaminic acid synthase